MHTDNDKGGCTSWCLGRRCGKASFKTQRLGSSHLQQQRVVIVVYINRSVENSIWACLVSYPSSRLIRCCTIRRMVQCKASDIKQLMQCPSCLLHHPSCRPFCLMMSWARLTCPAGAGSRLLLRAHFRAVSFLLECRWSCDPSPV